MPNRDVKLGLKRLVNRYDRQMMIPEWDQRALARAKILIAGVGALGNEVAKNLALTGVGHLILVDFDCVEYTNLNRTVLFSDKDVGTLKVKAASDSIRRLNPLIRVTTINKKVQDLFKSAAGASLILSGVTVLVGCLDNFEAKFNMNSASVARRIPIVDGGMLNAMGSVRVSIPPYTPCLECGIPQSVYARIGQRYRCEDLVFEDHTMNQMAVRHPTISTVTSVTAAIQSHEIIKIILGLDLFRSRGTWAQGAGKPVENEIQYDCRTNSFTTQMCRKDPECYVCGTRWRGADERTRTKPMMLSIANEEQVEDIVNRVQSALNVKVFNLVKGLRPFPDRSPAISDARNLFQKLNYLTRLEAKSALLDSKTQPCYRALQACLDSVVADAQARLRLGISFSPKELIEALQSVGNMIESLESRSFFSSQESLSTVLKIKEMIVKTIRCLGNDLTAGECGLENGDILCVIRKRAGLLRDIMLEVSCEKDESGKVALDEPAPGSSQA